MTKTASRARTSRAIKQVPQAAQNNANRQHMLTLTEDEGQRVIEARYMLQLLEEMTLSAEPEITMSRGSLAVMMAVIRKKLAFKSRLVLNTPPSADSPAPESRGFFHPH